MVLLTQWSDNFGHYSRAHASLKCEDPLLHAGTCSLTANHFFIFYIAKKIKKKNLHYHSESPNTPTIALKNLVSKASNIVITLFIKKK
jgi:hypothetical protein